MPVSCVDICVFMYVHALGLLLPPAREGKQRDSLSIPTAQPEGEVLLGPSDGDPGSLCNNIEMVTSILLSSEKDCLATVF